MRYPITCSFWVYDVGQPFGLYMAYCDVSSAAQLAIMKLLTCFLCGDI
jgi:hypothetical protein